MSEHPNEPLHGSAAVGVHPHQHPHALSRGLSPAAVLKQHLVCDYAIPPSPWSERNPRVPRNPGEDLPAKTGRARPSVVAYLCRCRKTRPIGQAGRASASRTGGRRKPRGDQRVHDRRQRQAGFRAEPALAVVCTRYGRSRCPRVRGQRPTEPILARFCGR